MISVFSLLTNCKLFQNAFIIQPNEVYENKEAENDLVLMSGTHGPKKKQTKESSEIILTVSLQSNKGYFYNKQFNSFFFMCIFM